MSDMLRGKVKDFFGIEEVEHVVSIPWVMQYGNKFTCGKSLAISNVIDNIPEFGLVTKIYHCIVLNANLSLQLGGMTII